MKNFVTQIVLATFALSGLTFSANALDMTEKQYTDCIVSITQSADNSYTLNEGKMRELVNFCNASVWHPLIEGTGGSKSIRHFAHLLSEMRADGVIPDLRAQEYGFRVISIGSGDSHSALSDALVLGNGGFKTTPVRD